MRSPEERITEVKRRIAKKERQKRLQQYRIAAAFAVAACLVVIVSVSLSLPGILNPTTCVRLRYGCRMDKFSGFSREHGYVHITLRKRSVYSQVRLSPRICLRESISTPFNRLFRQPAGLSLLRLHVTP